jgi:hypothetical protein
MASPSVPTKLKPGTSTAISDVLPSLSRRRSQLSWASRSLEPRILLDAQVAITSLAGSTLLLARGASPLLEL